MDVEYIYIYDTFKECSNIDAEYIYIYFYFTDKEYSSIDVEYIYISILHIRSIVV